MEQMNLQITQTAQPTFTVEVVQNLVPVISAQVVIGGNSGGTANIEFGDTMTGTGTPADPVNVSNDILDQIQDNASQIAEIQEIIPATANAQNQLADQGFVNSSIQTATAYFRGDWATWADVPSDPALYPADATGNHTPITNDYMVVIADEQENGGTWRYKYTGVWAEQGKTGWMPEYQVNETPLTAAQLAALNSGVTAQAVADITTNKNAIAGLQASKQDKLTAGTGITIDGNTISTSGSSEEYLPLSGGEITGPINYNAGELTSYSWIDHPLFTATFDIVGGSYRFNEAGLFANSNGLTIGVKGSAFPILNFLLRNNQIEPGRNNTVELGTAGTRFLSVATEKIISGIDASDYSVNAIIVPQKKGTMALVEDIDAALGDISTALTAILGE